MESDAEHVGRRDALVVGGCMRLRRSRRCCRSECQRGSAGQCERDDGSTATLELSCHLPPTSTRRAESGRTLPYVFGQLHLGSRPKTWCVRASQRPVRKQVTAPNG